METAIKLGITCLRRGRNLLFTEPTIDFRVDHFRQSGGIELLADGLLVVLRLAAFPTLFDFGSLLLLGLRRPPIERGDAERHQDERGD